MTSGGEVVAVLYIVNVLAAGLASLFFAASFICGLLYLSGFRKDLAGWNGRAIALGLLFLSLALAAGALRGELWRGRFWAWERREIWLLLVGLMYGGILFREIGAGWTERGLAWAAVLAFLAAIFSLPV